MICVLWTPILVVSDDSAAEVSVCVDWQHRHLQCYVCATRHSKTLWSYSLSHIGIAMSIGIHVHTRVYLGDLSVTIATNLPCTCCTC